jgi:hypothetical protein
MSKSIETKLNEALGALDKVGKRAKFDEQLKPIKEKAEGKPVAIETQLTLAEAILKESNIKRITEVAAQRTINKHNGASETFVEGNPFNEGRGSSFSEGYFQEEVANNNPFAKGDKLILEAMEKRGDITSEQKRVALGLPPAEFANLNESQQREYKQARMLGFSEADALKLSKMTAVGRNR